MKECMGKAIRAFTTILRRNCTYPGLISRFGWRFLEDIHLPALNTKGAGIDL